MGYEGRCWGVSIRDRLSCILSMVLQRFGVLTEYDSMSDEDIDVGISRLVGVYSKVLSSDFLAEFCQLYAGIKSRDPRK